MLATYGRTGSRRRQLTRDLRTSEEDILSDTKSLEKHIVQRSIPGSKSLQEPDPKSKVGSFIRSQKNEAPRSPGIPERVIKRLRPIIEAENIWGRPMPLRRQASIRHEHWAKTLEAMLPPVPAHEWNRLRDFVSGALPLEDPPKRRPRTGVAEKLTEEQNTARLLDYFTSPVDQHRIRRRDADTITVEENGVTYMPKPRETANVPEGDLYPFTPRQMRRLYAGIWRLTPTMSQDEVTKEWKTTWGAGLSPFLAGQVSTAKASEMELFEGAETIAVPNKNRRGARVNVTAG